MYNIAFRADGGPFIGMGHIMRCISFALEFKEFDCSILFLTNDDHEVLVKNGFKVIKILSERIDPLNQKKDDHLTGELEFLIDRIQKYKIDCLVVDHYGATLNYLSELKNSVKILVYIDDLFKINRSVDYIINGNIFADIGRYNIIDPTIEFLLGPKYTLLRKEFLNLPERRIREYPNQIMITTGGNDEFNLTIRLLKILLKSKMTMKNRFTCVVGEMFKDKKNLEKFAIDYENVELLYNVLNMCEIMQASDLVLTTSGSTLYELAITGTPSISFIVTENQEQIGKIMDELKSTQNLGWYNNIDDNTILEKITEILDNYPLRKEMSRSGKNLFDGKGPFRCVNAIIKSLNQNNQV